MVMWNKGWKGQVIAWGKDCSRERIWGSSGLSAGPGGQKAIVQGCVQGRAQQDRLRDWVPSETLSVRDRAPSRQSQQLRESGWLGVRRPREELCRATKPWVVTPPEALLSAWGVYAEEKKISNALFLQPTHFFFYVILLSTGLTWLFLAFIQL